MEKQEFIKRLKNELRWQLESKELGRVLREYGQYFDKAAAEGRSASEVSAELGEPALVATEILSERYGVGIAKKHATTGLIFALAALAFTTYTYIISPYMGTARYFWEGGGGISMNAVQLLVLTPTVLAFLVFPRIKNPLTVSVSKLAIADLALCAVGALGYIIMHQSVFLLVSNPNALATHPLWGIIGVRHIGSFFSNMLLLLALVITAFIVAVLLKVFKGGVMAIPLFYLNCTCLMAIYEYTSLLRQMSDPAAYTPALYQISMHAALGITITCLSFFVVRYMMKKRLTA